MTFLFFRLFGAIFNVILCVFFTKIVCIGANLDSGIPLTGCRRKAIRAIYWFQARVAMFFFGYRFKYKKVDVDYSEYLG
jgi:hypothetical protein